MVTNHNNMIGPKNVPIFPVPNFSIANKIETRINEIKITYLPSCGETTFKPSTALSTEIAGVIKLSPKNNAAT